MFKPVYVGAISIILGLCVSLGVFYFKNLAQKKEIDELKSDISVVRNEKTLCEAYLKKQNEAIKKQKIEPKEPKEIKAVQRIYIKDKTCQAELKAYKELMNASY